MFLSFAEKLNRAPKRHENNEAITPVTMMKYGRPTHNLLCSLLPLWQVKTVILHRILTLHIY